MRTVLFTALLASFAVPALADDKPPPQLAELRKWIGKWSGKGSITTEGKTHAVAMTYDCVESAGAAGVKCRAVITGLPGFTYQFDDLWGFSTVDNLVHWYTVTNAGEVHDHRGHLDATGGFVVAELPTEGKLFSEQITFKRKPKATTITWVTYLGTGVRERGDIELVLK
jgi:hypothetical protein